MARKIYVTTTIPYVNAQPHLGFALELAQADATARFHRRLGRQVRFQTGTDENALKNVLAAREQGLSVGELVERNSRSFRDLAEALHVSADTFIRTTQPGHRAGVHALWRRLRSGDLYRKNYRGLYCTGCEDFYLETQLVDGRCPEHGTAPVEVAEENYFFRLSAYQAQIERLLADSTIRVVPEARRSEVLSFVRGGLRDISVSRSAARAGGWGIAVPGDESQIIYVWIDALTNYLSGSGFGSGDAWTHWWNDRTEKIHLIGKNVWKFHAVYWPAMLLSAELPLPDRIIVHGFLTVEGRKIGKSLGNVVDPFRLLSDFGPDAVRYYLLGGVPPFGDADFSRQKLGELYQTDLANGLGNLLSRVTALCARAGFGRYECAEPPEAPTGYLRAFERCEFDKAASALWSIIDDANRDIERSRPWELLKASGAARLKGHLARWLGQLHRIGHWLEPLLPEASGRILAALSAPRICAAEALFPRFRQSTHSAG